MKRLFLILIAFTFFSYQMITVKEVRCGQNNTVYGHEVIVLDTLKFVDAHGFLIQDNAVLYIYNVEGHGHIRRGGKAAAPYNPIHGGLDRFDSDANPMVVLIGDPEKFNSLEVETQNNEGQTVIDLTYAEN